MAYICLSKVRSNRISVSSRSGCIIGESNLVGYTIDSIISVPILQLMSETKMRNPATHTGFYDIEVGTSDGDTYLILHNPPCGRTVQYKRHDMDKYKTVSFDSLSQSLKEITR